MSNTSTDTPSVKKSVAKSAPIHAVTAPMQFNNMGSQSLFEVAGGVPSAEALYQASAFLSSARDIAAYVAEGQQGNEHWGIVSLIELAKVIVDSVTMGIERATTGESA